MIKRLFGKPGAGGAAPQSAPESPESIVARIAQGDDALRETFIADYRPYIAKAASRFARRYIDPSRDEFSVALAAFNEAIDGFSHTGGRSFLGFADTVIRRRLIDYVRKEQRHARSVPMSAFDIEGDEEMPVNPVETAEAMAVYEADRHSEARRLEIEVLSMRLSRFGVSFSDLADQSPKHRDSRIMLYGIGAELASNRDLFTALITKHQLPIKELIELCGVSRKTLERNRKFIIAAALIIEGDFPYLKAYMQVPGRDEAAASKEVTEL